MQATNSTIPVEVPAAKVPGQFGPSYNGNYPEEMRTQLWPLCCGARIISGFKAAHTLTIPELVAKIEATINAVPDHQVYSHEKMKPSVVFLTLNSSQMQSIKIMEAVKEAKFVLFAKGTHRSNDQGFFVRDDSNSFKVVQPD